MASLLKSLFEPRNLKNWPWITLLLILAMAAIHMISEGMGVRQAWRDSYGFMPDKFATYITHAFLHADQSHIKGNLRWFLLFGSFVEMGCGRVWYVCSIMLTAICGASLTAVAIADYWPTDENPVGFSIVISSFGVVGSYVISRFTLRQALRKIGIYFISVPSKSLIQVVPCAVAAAVLMSILAEEYQPEMGVTELGHTIGAIIGALLTFLCVSRNPK